MIDALSDGDLAALVDALRSGRLTAPFSTASVQAVYRGKLASVVADELQAQGSLGATGRHLAWALERVATARARTPAAEDAISLVWTGPEVEGTANRDTRVVVQELFSTARESVLIAGFAVYQGARLFEPLASRFDADPNLQVRMILDIQRRYGDSTDAAAIVREFADRFWNQEWPGKRRPEVFYDPRSVELSADRRASMHVKCIVVDGVRSFVTSANLTEAAHERNFELGVLVESRVIANSIVEQFTTLVSAGHLLRLAASGSHKPGV
ncbi:MAG: phospholipase [Planctomycetes bacterium]|nr:phospholipase [Planctomycetota bacterium]